MKHCFIVQLYNTLGIHLFVYLYTSSMLQINYLIQGFIINTSINEKLPSLPQKTKTSSTFLTTDYLNLIYIICSRHCVYVYVCGSCAYKCLLNYYRCILYNDGGGEVVVTKMMVKIIGTKSQLYKSNNFLMTCIKG
jgi:hypothetical protein